MWNPYKLIKLYEIGRNDRYDNENKLNKLKDKNRNLWNGLKYVQNSSETNIIRDTI
jgi:hypothetical protein